MTRTQEPSDRPQGEQRTVELQVLKVGTGKKEVGLEKGIATEIATEIVAVEIPGSRC